jgi:protein arginine kinase
LVNYEKHADIVLSSRVRLARNIEHYPFPEWAGSKQLNDIKQKIGKFSKKLKFNFFDFEDLGSMEKRLMAEKRLVSHTFIEHEGNGKAVLIDKSGGTSVMVNEEDHLRIQCIKKNLALEDAWKKVGKVDDIISAEIPFAFSQNLGFYTACPTNLGTGLRASIMMHLPAVVLTKRIYPLVKTLNEKGISVRGMFGEGTVAFGNTFQITNQHTLGLNERAILDLLNAGHDEVLKTEMTCRKNLMRRDKIFIEDKVKRAVGTLKYAVLLNLEESLELFSTIKMGISLDLIKGKSKLKKISDLTTKIETAHLCERANKELGSLEEKKARANLIRAELDL